MMHREGERLMIERVRKRGLVALLAAMTPIDEAFSRNRRSRACAGAHRMNRYLLTNITSEFERVRGLKVENWLA